MNSALTLLPFNTAQKQLDSVKIFTVWNRKTCGPSPLLIVIYAGMVCYDHRLPFSIQLDDNSVFLLDVCIFTKENSHKVQDVSNNFVISKLIS